MRNIFAIKREERVPALIAFAVVVALNVLMVMKYYDRFTLGGNLGFWSVFYGYFTVSGYDDLTYIELSRWKIMHLLYRHPLLSLFCYPLAMFNHWQMGITEVNYAVYIVAVILVVCDVYSFIFMYRIVREIIGLRRGDSLLLTAMLFSFAHIMIVMFVPDHFGVSLFLLLLTLYVTGRAMKERRQLNSVTMAVLFIVTAGVTLTNGAKTMLAALFAGGRRFFAWRNMLVGVLLPVAVLTGCYLYQHFAIELPENIRVEKIANKRLKEDKVFAAKQKEHADWVKAHAGTQLSDSPFFEWTDISTSRVDAAVENFFGESIQLHRSHLLEDTNRTRPNYVAYDSVINYIVEAIIVILFIAGVWFGRRNKLMQLCLAWFAVDILLHFVLGFGILEVYIMAAHWAFIIPIAIAYLLKALRPQQQTVLRVLLICLTAYLWIYNGVLTVGYMVE